MKDINFIYKPIENCEQLTNSIKKQLENETEDIWDKYNFRALNGGAQQDTFCIPLYWINNNWMDNSSSTSIDIYRFVEFERYFNFVENIKNILLRYYPDTILYQVAFTKLPGKKIISPHTDCSSKCSYPHRIHVVIKSDSNVIFYINKIAHNFKEGEIVEINNMEEHGVINDSNEDRIHLLIDLINSKHLPFGFQYKDVSFEDLIVNREYYFGKNAQIRQIM